MRKIREQVRFCWGNDGSELHARLDDAISWASGLEQGIDTASEEYAKGEQAIKDALMDLSVALLGRNIKFEGLVEYSGDWTPVDDVAHQILVNFMHQSDGGV